MCPSKNFLLLCLFSLFYSSCVCFQLKGLPTDPCSDAFGYILPRCYSSKCPLRKDYIDSITNALHENVAGQEEAIFQIISSLMSHQGDHPLVFHFSGANGVGKTLTAEIIAHAKFATFHPISGHPKGMLYLRGSNFLYDQDGSIRRNNPSLYFTKIEEFKEIVREEIVNQLEMCPESVIIFDEYTIPNRRIIATLEEFLDGKPIRVSKGEFISSAKSVFIFLSDFGVEDFSDTHTEEELIEKIEEDVRNCWGDHLQKMRHLQDNIIPFREMPIVDSPYEELEVPNSVDDLINLLLDQIIDHNRIKELLIKKSLHISGIECNYLCRSQIGKIIYSKQLNSLYRFRNYRGVAQLFEQQVTQQLINLLIQSETQSGLRFQIKPDVNQKRIKINKIVFEIKRNLWEIPKWEL